MAFYFIGAVLFYTIGLATSIAVAVLDARISQRLATAVVGVFYLVFVAAVVAVFRRLEFPSYLEMSTLLVPFIPLGQILRYGLRLKKAGDDVGRPTRPRPGERSDSGVRS